MSSFEEPTEWIEREWELRKRNEEIEERQKHTREDLEVEVALLKNEEDEEEGGSKETSALAKSLQKCVNIFPCDIPNYCRRVAAGIVLYCAAISAFPGLQLHLLFAMDKKECAQTLQVFIF